MLTAWRKGRLVSGWNEPLQAWQRALWLSLFGPGGRLSGADSATLPEFFARTPPAGAARPRPRARVRHLVRRAPLSIDLRVAGARDAGLHLHAEPVPRAVGGPSTRAPRAAQATCGVAPAGARARRRRGAGGFGRRRRESAARALGTAGARQHPALQRPVRLQFPRTLRGPRGRHGGADAARHPAAGGSGPRAAPPRTGTARRQPDDGRRPRSPPGAGSGRRGDLVAAAARPDAALRRLRGRRSARVRRDVPAARPRGVHVRVRAAAHRARSPVARRGPRHRGGGAAAGASARRAGAAGSAAAGDAPDGGASLSRGRPAAFPGAVRGAGHRPGRRRRRARRQLCRRGSRQLGPGSAAARAGRVPVGRAQR